MFKAIIVITIFLFSPVFVYAAEPVICFSDITSGPDTGLGDGKGSGAIVTIWGWNLGTPAIINGNPAANYSVYFTDSGATKRSAAYIYYWVNADGGASGGGPSDLYTYHNMQEIAFSIPDSAMGAGTITVEANGVDSSNSLPFTVRSGSIYYVATNGSDDKAGTWAEPYATVGYPGGAFPDTTEGDIIYIRGNNDSGTITLQGSGGIDPEKPTAVIAYPGEFFQAIASTGSGIIPFSMRVNSEKYFVVSKAYVESNSTGIGTTDGMRIIGCEITDYPNGTGTAEGGTCQ